MAELTILHQDLERLRGEVVIVTGGSSGIGLATVNLLLSLGALVVSGDISAPEASHPNLTYVKTDVTNWSDLMDLFETALSQHNRINHVFCNAGIRSHALYHPLPVTETGEPLEPSQTTLSVNLHGAINTATLALHYLQRNPPAVSTSTITPSIVLGCSSSAFLNFEYPDYTASKYSLLGWFRGMRAHLLGTPLKTAVRLNLIAPSWTTSALLPESLLKLLGEAAQPADAVARSVALLMADGKRDGETLYSVRGRFAEVEKKLVEAAEKVVKDALPGLVHDPYKEGKWR